MAIHRAGKGVMQRVPALLVLVPVEHGEIDHPQRPPRLLGMAFFMSDFHAQRTQRIVDDFRLVGAEENQVAVFRARTLHDRMERFVRQVLDDRRLQAFTPLARVVYLDVGQTPGAVDGDEFGVAVDLAAGERAAPGDQQAGNAATGRIGRAREHFEIHRLHDLGEFGE